MKRPVVATWNIGSGPDVDKMRGLARLVDHGADVIGLQEAGDRHRLLDEFAATFGWRQWLGGDVPGSGSVPIVWNPRTVHAVRLRTLEATPATYVGPDGAGGPTMKAKVWTRLMVHAQADDGQLGRFLFTNGHVVPSVYLPARARLARTHIKALAAAVHRWHRHPWGIDGAPPIVSVGDFNMRPDHRLAKPLRDAGMKQRTPSPTHGARTIDHVWTRGAHGRAIVLPMPSDHRAVVFEVRPWP